MQVNKIVLTSAFTLGSQLILEIPTELSENDDSDLTSAEEEEIVIILATRKRKLQTPQRIKNYMENTVPGYTVQQFQQHFRITIDAYEHILNILGPQLRRQGPIGRSTINVEKQILSVIWLLATPDSFRSVGERFDLAKSSLSVCFIRVIKLLQALAPRIISWPTPQDMEYIKNRFYGLGGMNNVVGAVDGTYIQIKAPKEDPESYITRKCNYAFTLQAISDPWLHFTDIFIGYPGSVSDARIFKNSDIYKAVLNNLRHYFPENEFIIGDKAYPVLNWCIPPYINRGNLTNAQTYFNTVHARTRQVIERAFALLLGRFRRLKFLDMNRHDLIPGTVLAASVLHNICLDYNDLLIEEYINEGINHVMNNDDVEDVPHHMAEEGRMQRDRICRA